MGHGLRRPVIIYLHHPGDVLFHPGGGIFLSPDGGLITGPMVRNCRKRRDFGLGWVNPPAGRVDEIDRRQARSARKSVPSFTLHPVRMREARPACSQPRH